MFEDAFESVLRQYEDAIEDKKRFTGLIKDFFYDQQKNVNLMLMAYDVGIVEQIKTTDRISTAFAYRFVKQLVDDYGLSRANADWIVSVWCVCFGRNILGKDCEIQIQHGKGPAIESSEEGESKSSGQKYGDLFRYTTSSQGDGLAVSGFSGDTSHTIIFQNKSGNRPVIEIGEGVFEGKDIEEIIITEGYQYIGKMTFRDNKKLHQVVMPYTLLEIGDESFEGCVELKRVTLTERLERIGQAAFKHSGLRTVMFPSTVYYVGADAFAGCGELDNIKIPKNIDRIADGMFEACPNLKRIELAEGITEIGDRAFRDCEALDILTIPDSVKKIGEDAFEGVSKKFIIQCSFGSYAEEYARNHKIKYQLI